MRKIVYYVAISMDGFIAGKDDDISGFAAGGEGVKAYQKDLAAFDTVIMGRRTYEFGYQYGLIPGTRAYSHMDHYIFSKTLNFETQDDRLFVCERNINIISELKNRVGSDIYLCGGGQFAGWLLENEMIDIIKVKLNPFIQGSGIKLFENIKKDYQLVREAAEWYDDIGIITYHIKY